MFVVPCVHPRKGPFKVVECIGESDYKIKAPPPLEVIHFNPLKPCLAGTRIPTPIRTDWCADYIDQFQLNGLSWVSIWISWVWLKCHLLWSSHFLLNWVPSNQGPPHVEPYPVVEVLPPLLSRQSPIPVHPHSHMLPSTNMSSCILWVLSSNQFFTARREHVITLDYKEK